MPFQFYISLPACSFPYDTNTQQIGKVIHDSSFKSKIRTLLPDFTPKDYSVLCDPPTNASKVEEWIAEAKKLNRQPILSLAKKESHEPFEKHGHSIHDPNNGFSFESVINSAVALANRASSQETAKYQQMVNDLRGDIESLKKTFEDNQVANQRTIESMKSLHERVVKAGSRVHQLAHFMSVVREKIIDRVNVTERTSFSDWESMMDCLEARRKTSVVDRIVLDMGFEDLREWYQLANLKGNFNTFNHDRIPIEQARRFVEELKDSSYEDYAPAFRTLNNVIEQQKF